MFKQCLVISFLGLALFTKAQSIINTDTLRLNSKEAITNKKLFSDSLASSFCIIIHNEVKLHKHVQHAEHVIVQEGEAMMTLGDKQFMVKKNDVIFIPKNTFHAVKVTSPIPLKVISIQTPLFDGSDRVFKE
jgi:mannose-6-phosphate isomerase-like protein (cupin superfamily)